MVSYLLDVFISHKSTPYQTLIHRQLPTDINAALNRFKMDGETVTYAHCPKCNYGYKPNVSEDGSVTWPVYCTNLEGRVYAPEHFPSERVDIPQSGICREPLLRPPSASGGPRTPIKPFVAHSFHEYVTALILEHEDVLDFTTDEAFNRMKSTDSPELSTFWDANFVRDFKSPDGTTFFIDRPTGEGRLLFTLSTDFFNAEGNLMGGAHTSTGIISLACLNLPPEIRYQPEYMFLAGIIPGPKEPPLAEMNHYFRHVVTELKESWERGIKISATPNCPNGKVVRSAVAAFVADLPAARKLTALASYGSHHFCSACTLFGLDQRTRCDHHNWSKTDIARTRELAEAWRSAATVKEQSILFNSHGVRWSELWRLPYFDPGQQLVVDAMHCVLLGLCKFYSREVLGLSVEDVKKQKARQAFPMDVVPPLPAQPPEGGTPPTTSSKAPNGSTNTHKDDTALTPAARRDIGSIHRRLQSNINIDETDNSAETSAAYLKKKLVKCALPALQFTAIDLGIPLIHSASVGDGLDTRSPDLATGPKMGKFPKSKAGAAKSRDGLASDLLKWVSSVPIRFLLSNNISLAHSLSDWNNLMKVSAIVLPRLLCHQQSRKSPQILRVTLKSL